MRRVDLTGRRFDKLTCVADVGLDKTGSRLWLCICDCGNHATHRAGVLAATRKRGMACRQCGEKAKSTARRKHGDHKTPLYNAWRNMRARCRRNTPKNAYWAGKGITVCETWHDYAAFKAWALGAGYREGLAIDRINPDGNYTPENCRWVTISQNTVYSLDRRYGRAGDGK